VCVKALTAEVWQGTGKRVEQVGGVRGANPSVQVSRAVHSESLCNLPFAMHFLFTMHQATREAPTLNRSSMCARDLAVRGLRMWMNGALARAWNRWKEFIEVRASTEYAHTRGGLLPCSHTHNDGDKSANSAHVVLRKRER